MKISNAQWQQNSVWGDELHCPHCGSENLHHVQTFMYCRREDKDGVFVISDPVSGLVSQSKLKKDDEGNPSMRRHATVLMFDCEGCHDNPALIINQHKGISFLKWEE